MSVIDVSYLLTELSTDAPCGEDLEYDLAFGELERAAQSKPEQQFGDTIVPAEEPNWKNVRKLAVDLFERTKDLRVAVHLFQSLLNTSGIAGLQDGLALLQGLLVRYWDSVHPQLDPDDSHDPTLRMNTLAGLFEPNYVLRVLREAPLVSVQGVGEFSLKDVHIATGAVVSSTSIEQGASLDSSTIDAAFLACETDTLRSLTGDIEQCLTHLREIESSVNNRVGTVAGIDSSPLSELLTQMYQVLSEQLSRKLEEEDEIELDESDFIGTNHNPMQRQKGITGEIRSRDDVRKVLDNICKYYEKNEPSSPVPILLQRAKRLVAADFMQILKDMVPNGVGQAEIFIGQEVDK